MTKRTTRASTRHVKTKNTKAIVHQVQFTTKMQTQEPDQNNTPCQQEQAAQQAAQQEQAVQEEQADAAEAQIASAASSVADDLLEACHAACSDEVGAARASEQELNGSLAEANEANEANEADDTNANENDDAGEAFITRGGLSSTTDGSCRFQRTPRLGSELLPVPLPNQLVAAVSLAAPSNEATKASACAIRIVGVFPSQEMLQEHVDDLPQMNVYAVPTAKPFTFGTMQFATPEEKVEYVNSVVERFAHNVTRKHREFEHYINQRQINDPEVRKQLDLQERLAFEAIRRRDKLATHALTAGVEQYKASAEVANLPKAPKLKAVHDVRDQKYAVVSIICEDEVQEGTFDEADDKNTARPQWVVAVWGAFPDEQSATAYLSDTVQHEHTYMNHYVVKMYEWIYCDLVLQKNLRKKAKPVCAYQEQQQLWTSAYNTKGAVRAQKKLEEQQNTAEELRKRVEDDIKRLRK